jgi:hypothetical protein
VHLFHDACFRRICYLSAVMKPLKTLLLWLLLLAIPVQGLASNVMTICKASHQRVTQTAASDHSLSHHSMHQGSVAHDAKHHQHHHHDFSEHDGAGDMSVHSDTAPDQQLSSCSACAACSVGASCIHSHDVVLSASAAPSSIISYFAFHVPGVVPERPEHPPRTSLV